MSEASTRTLIEDLRAVVAEAEALIAASAGDASDRAGDLKHHATESIGKARARLEELEAAFTARAKAATEEATRYVRDNPLQSVGIAAAVGIVIGLLLGRR